MRKVTAIFLLACILLNISGLLLFFSVQKAWLKQEMRVMLASTGCSNSNAVETFIIDPADQGLASQLEWEGSDEFRYQGRMYDVVDKHTRNNQLIIHGISDKKETSLLNTFRKANEKQSKHQSNLLTKLLSIQFIPSPSVPVVAGKKQERVYTISLSQTLQHPDRKILTPPPQSAS